MKATLDGLMDAEATLWRALADLIMGRARDAEHALRPLLAHPDQGSRAHLHLALVLIATQRGEEAESLLRRACDAPDAVADEARVVLAERAQSAGDLAGAAALTEGIRDPWIKRELSGRLGLVL